MFNLKQQLKKLRGEASPSKDFKQALWSELSGEFDKAYRPTRVWRLKLIAIPALALVLLVTTGTGVYAYASPGVGDGHALYPMKRGIEGIEKKFAASPEARVQFHMKMMDRRLDEVDKLDELHRHKIKRLRHAVGEFDQSREHMMELRHRPEMRKMFSERLGTEQRRYLDHVRKLDIPEEEKRQLLRDEFQPF